MKIAICIKIVPDPSTIEVDPFTGEIDKRRVLHIINPADVSSLEIALRLRTSADSIQVLCVGPPSADHALRDTLAVGANKAMRLWENTWDRTFPERTAQILAGVLAADSPADLILCGNRSTDRASGIVPSLLAEMINYPAATDVTDIELKGSILNLHRRLARGAREQVQMELPALIALTPGLAHLRHASLPDLIEAQQTQIPVLQPANLDLQDHSLFAPGLEAPKTHLPRIRSQPIFTPDSTLSPYQRIESILSGGIHRKKGVVLEGTAQEAAHSIIEYLQERGYFEE
jgi:electron transfer flavoprotein beta subunit